MVERAYSLEVKKTISAFEAQKYSLEGRLNSEKNFRCIDQDCQIPLTCTNWKKKDGKRFYFKPSHNDELHVEGCTCISPQEVKDQVSKEFIGAKGTVSDGGIISVKKSLSKARVTGDTVVGSLDIAEQSRNSSRTNISSNQLQDRQFYSVATFVELYENPQIDNNVRNIRIEGELISLNEYFVDTTGHIVEDRQRIFYGLAWVSIADFNPDMLQIEFIGSDYPKVFSNIERIKERSNTKNIADLIDKEPEYIYFRGKLNSKTKKFESFNDKFYKDLYTPKD
ncbi:hypothetical protein [Streptococcus oralis]|uniref:Uncharacterized protein n=1 Tax=Streptococcus oralis TaxID=1303 RepID=A0A139QLV4_STROR|nr:hypothetical protein [Streptococcus oralis]KXU03341.1 hypothetical protein SORDD24_01873 [Streptococcus oralis]